MNHDHDHGKKIPPLKMDYEPKERMPFLRRLLSNLLVFLPIPLAYLAWVLFPGAFQSGNCPTCGACGGGVCQAVRAPHLLHLVGFYASLALSWLSALRYWALELLTPLFGRPVRAVLPALGLVVILALSADNSTQPDLPGPTPNIVSVEAGSWIIPMDNTLQPGGNAFAFNIRAYGLVVRLLNEGIPVQWAIRAGKGKDGVDFTALARRVYPSSGSPQTLDFKAGPFIIPKDFVELARPIIQSFNASSPPVQVYQLEQDVMVDVRYTLSFKPRIAVSTQNTSIITQVLDAAGIPNSLYTVISDQNLSSSSCYTIFMAPHTNIGEVSLQGANNLKSFILDGGNFYAQCQAVSAYENFNNFYAMTTAGLTVLNTNSALSYPNPDLPFAQFEGALDPTSKGSERDFYPTTGGFINNGHILAQNPAPPQNYFAAAAAKLRGGVGGMVFYLGGHNWYRNLTDISWNNGLRMTLNAILVPAERPPSCGLYFGDQLRWISGQVYEDPSGAAQPYQFIGRPGVRVRLYRDVNGNGQLDSSDPFLSEKYTDSSGLYRFRVSLAATGQNYLIVVDSRSVSPSAGFNGGFGQGDVWAEQTYGDDPATPALDLGPRYGGKNPGASDGFNQADPSPSANLGAKHIARVVVSGGNVSGVDFAFSFNVVTNLRGGDGADDDTAAGRTVQGSLRQFIQNANAIQGSNAMRFVPADPYTPPSGGWWTLPVTQALPAITDANTTLDGTAYDARAPLSVRDTNPGQLGTGGTVGVGGHPLSQIPRPELALDLSGLPNTFGSAPGLDVQTTGTTVTKMAFYGRKGFNFHLLVRSTGDLTLSQSVIGVLPDGTTPPVLNQGVGLRADGKVRVENNFFAYLGRAIDLRNPSTSGSTIRQNELAYVGPNGAITGADGITLFETNGVSVEKNLIRNMDCSYNGPITDWPGFGIELWQNVQNTTISQNTIDGACLAGIAVLNGSSDVTIQGNIIKNTQGWQGQGGAGVLVSRGVGSSDPIRVKITQNHFGGNRSNAIDLVHPNSPAPQTDGITLNNGVCNETGPNRLIDYPVLTQAFITGGNLEVQGTACPGATVEVYQALVGSGDVLGGLGYGEGVRYLGSTVADGSGNFALTIPLPSGLGAGDELTALAIDGDGNTSEFSANKAITSGYTLSGQVYHDREPNGAKNSGEDWSGGPTVYVKLIQGSSVMAVQAVPAGSGSFTFTGVAPGSYTLIVDNNSNTADTTPTPPSGWLFINPASGSRSVTVGNTDVLGQEFGLFHGGVVEGRLFYDDGEGTSTANNALQDGAERGVGGVTVSATDGTNTRTATTDGSGFYRLYIPASWGSVTLSHPVRPATGWNDGSTPTQVGSWADATGPASGGAVVSLGAASALAGGTLVRNFGVVRPSELKPDQSGQTTSPGTLTYAHLFRPGTLGSVVFSLGNTPGLSYQARFDANCDGTWDPAETFSPLPLNVSVGATWPRDPDGRLRACALEVRVLAPAGLPAGYTDVAVLGSGLTWANNPNVVEERYVVDTTTVILAGQLQLSKEVRNLTQNTPFSTNVQARPGEVLEYRISYQNIGSEPIFQVVLQDPIPFFATLVQDAYGNGGEVELTCPDGTVVRPDLGSVSSIRLDLANHCPLPSAPYPGGGSAPALLPGQGGFFLYQVQVN